VLRDILKRHSNGLAAARNDRRAKNASSLFSVAEQTEKKNIPSRVKRQKT